MIAELRRQSPHISTKYEKSEHYLNILACFRHGHVGNPCLPYISNNFPFSQPLHPSNVWQDEKLCRGRSKSRNRRSLTRGERGRLQACGDLTIFEIHFPNDLKNWWYSFNNMTDSKQCFTWFFCVSSLWSLRLLMSLAIPDFRMNIISCRPSTALSACPSGNNGSRYNHVP